MTAVVMVLSYWEYMEPVSAWEREPDQFGGVGRRIEKGAEAQLKEKRAERKTEKREKIRLRERRREAEGEGERCGGGRG